MQRLVIALVTAVLAVLLAGACVPASAAGVYLVPVYDLSASAYDGVAAQRAGAPSEEAPVASNGVSDGVQVTLPTPPGPLSPLLSASTAANTAARTSSVVDDVLAETAGATQRNLTSSYTLSADEALTAGQRWVGQGYTELGKPGSGVFRSTDGLRQFRMDGNSLMGNHAPGVPHVHLETYAPGARVPTVNNHIPFLD
ncbi:hypothetical protein [Actinotalea sp. K2]|uniref:hypothetical protein n=1 Tax=Actinotalea sp. K2 TaxID=2939438 RepID=UPI0020175C2F|nr:hypothetical protein [Actinotalea sp. K2]MCL3862097.1 hypothetical protein [Actinotalea sp. K2]